ncbi:MAG: class I SAM-dependent methyltransferase [Sphingopyxis sp.]|uniref:class I SAM-dependent methyltransferase n=1 Tax=Sphingopyxis sp. TaxID=1908224 RepID=UPI002ABAE780|nr:class I SAM-dependent methyltransferase [Sphingopyxis sp.]MDZ3830960.1 class I SAM-dependent methyltransferase [Sphingopyxis sp.]
MAAALSPRLQQIVEALPLAAGLRILEIGCGPGAASRAIAQRIGTGHILGIDRSAKAIAQAAAQSAELIASGRMSYRHVAIEDLELEPGEARYDFAFAVRVGALDGRHPAAGLAATTRLKAVLKPGGRLFIDDGNPLREVDIGGGV